MHTMMNTKKPIKAKPTSLRVTQHARDLLVLLAEKHGISQAAIIELAIREKAERDGIKS